MSEAKNSAKATIIIAMITAVGGWGTALITNWGSVFGASDAIDPAVLLEETQVELENVKTELDAAKEDVGKKESTIAELELGLQAAEGQLAQFSTRVAGVRIEQYHTGEDNKGFGRHFTCGERAQNLPQIVCGPSSTPAGDMRTSRHGGGQCGYHYFVVACVPNA